MADEPHNLPPQRTRADRELDEAERWMRSDPRDRRRLAWALGMAVVLHAGVLLARMPDFGPEPVRVQAPEQAMKVQFLKPPPPPQARPEPPKPEVKKIAHPDPTPDEPEPVVEEPAPAPAPVNSDQFSQEPSPADAETMGPIRVSPGQGPGVIKKVEPIYPPAARAARLQNTVVIDAVIRKDGTVADVTVVKSGNPMFDKSAVDAVRQWLFTPGNHDVILSVTVTFQLR
jgi:protein TonB